MNDLVTECPNCHMVQPTQVPADPKHVIQPRPGNLSICTRCACVSIFLPDLRLRALRRDELLILPNGVQLQITTATQAILAQPDQSTRH